MAMLRKQKQQRIAAVRARSSLFQGLSPEQRAQDPYLASLDCVMEAAEDARAKLKFTGVLPAEGFVGWNYKLGSLCSYCRWSSNIDRWGSVGLTKEDTELEQRSADHQGRRGVLCSHKPALLVSRQPGLLRPRDLKTKGGWGILTMPAP